MGSYDIAQVCLNGHLINASTQRSPEFSKKFCSRCGAPTTTTCTQCDAPIQGEYHVEGIVDFNWPRQTQSLLLQLRKPLSVDRNGARAVL